MTPARPNESAGPRWWGLLRRAPGHRLPTGGMTLAEAVVSVALFALVMAVVGQLTVTAYRVHVRSVETASVHRRATVAADRLSRELRLCEEVYAPDPLEYTSREVDLVVFRRHDPGGDLVVGYRFDREAGEIRRLLYRPDFAPADPERQRLSREPQVLAGEVREFQFWAVDPSERYGARFAGFRWVVSGTSGGDWPIQTEVRVKGL